MEVPLIVLVPPFSQSEVMLLPGAYRSTQPPQFENDDLASVLVDEATVVTLAALEGEKLHASALLLPAATATNTPELARLLTAVLSELEKPPPRLMLATAGWIALVASQLRPAMMPEVEPEPLQSRTRTARSIAPLATPKRAPATVPETCVPCPLQSCPLPPKAS